MKESNLSKPTEQAKPYLLYYLQSSEDEFKACFDCLKAELKKNYRLILLSGDCQILEENRDGCYSAIQVPEKPEPEIRIRRYQSAFENILRDKGTLVWAKAFLDIFEQYHDNSFFISDVSAELTILASLVGLPVIHFRYNANIKEDPTQVFAYECANCIVAPYTAAVENYHYGYRDKTRYLNFFTDKKCGFNDESKEQVITIVLPDHDIKLSTLVDIVEVCKRPINIVGIPDLQYKETLDQYPNVYFAGSIEYLSESIKGNIVIAPARNGLIAELICLGKRSILIPKPRPHAEQHNKAFMMEEAGLAVTLMPGHDGRLDDNAFYKALVKAQKIDTDQYEKALNATPGIDLVNVIHTIDTSSIKA